MTVSTLIVAAAGALDVGAARRLADYRELDDPDVARALEQVHIQRWGRIDLPGHLRRLAGWAAVAADGDIVRLDASVDGATEAETLSRLFEIDIRCPCRLVDWDGTLKRWLLARASAVEQTAPNWLRTADVEALRDRLAPAAPDHPADPEVVEAESRLLFDPAFQPGPSEPSLVARAASRARLWWRSAQVHAEITPAARTRLVDALASQYTQ